MGGGSFLQKMSEFGDYMSSFPLKLGKEDEVEKELTIGKMGVCGFMSKAKCF